MFNPYDPESRMSLKTNTPKLYSGGVKGLLSKIGDGFMRMNGFEVGPRHDGELRERNRQKALAWLNTDPNADFFQRTGQAGMMMQKQAPQFQDQQVGNTIVRRNQDGSYEPVYRAESTAAEPEQIRLLRTMGVDPASPEGRDILEKGMRGYQYSDEFQKGQQENRMALQEFRSQAQMDALQARMSQQQQLSEARMQQQMQIAQLRDELRGDNTITPKETFKEARQLRKDFDALPEVKSYKAAAPVLASLYKTPKTAQGDLDFVYAMGKIFDPDSVVREGEMQLIISQGSIIDKVSGKVWRMTGTGPGLPQNVRNALLRAAENRVARLADAYGGARRAYEGYGRDYGIDAKQITGYHPGDTILKAAGRPARGMPRNSRPATRTPTKKDPLGIR